MAYAFNEHIQTIAIQSGGASAVRSVPWFKAPRPLTIKAAYAVTESGILTNTSATLNLSMAILNGGTVGTSTNTCGTFGTSTTPYTWTARQGYQATFDSTAEQDFAQGEWVVAQVTEVGSTVTGVLVMCVHHVEGTGRVS